MKKPVIFTTPTPTRAERLAPLLVNAWHALKASSVEAKWDYLDEMLEEMIPTVGEAKVVIDAILDYADDECDYLMEDDAEAVVIRLIRNRDLRFTSEVAAS